MTLTSVWWWDQVSELGSGSMTIDSTGQNGQMGEGGLLPSRLCKESLSLLVAVPFLSCFLSLFYSFQFAINSG